MEIGAASGIVSLFLAKWANDNSLKNKIYCIEPSLTNVQFLEESSDINSFQNCFLILFLLSASGFIASYRLGKRKNPLKK